MSISGKIPSDGKSENTSTRGSYSIAGSKQSLPLNYGGLGKIFYDQLSLNSDKVSQVDTIHNITETKGSVKIRGIKLAVEMAARGVGVNDIILISSKTHSHQTIVLIATLFLGAIVCPVNPEAPFKESLGLVKKLKPKMCFCDSRTVSQIDRILQNLSMSSVIVNFGNEVPGTVQFIKLFPFKEETDFNPFFIENPQKEVAFILPTSGTSGEPKLVCLSHHNIYIQAVNFIELFQNPSKIISFFPLSALTQTIIACASLEYGITRIMATNFNERTACKMIHDFVIDVAVFGTELAIRLIHNVAVRDFNMTCLKYVLVGIVSSSKEDMQMMRQALPTVKFIQIYTLTETGCIAAVPPSDYSTAMDRPWSVGRLLTNCKVKIVDKDTRETLTHGKFGELLFKGDGLMLGYFKDSQATLAATEKGYFKTGDLAKYDESGWIYLQGRIEDMILLDNDKVPPTHFENAILGFPGVHDVVIICNEQDIVTCIEKKPDANIAIDSIKSFIHREIPDYYQNFTAKVVFFDEFPRTCAGTVKRRVLREELLGVKLEYTRSLASIITTNTLNV